MKVVPLDGESVPSCWAEVEGSEEASADALESVCESTELISSVAVWTEASCSLTLLTDLPVRSKCLHLWKYPAQYQKETGLSAVK